ncbi:MAG: 3-isopropylmalate dehydratase small subunit, partial [Frankiaceae bacterium]|nr:3-isopropylmalate dehydratase small subunit [Frankiaceae bacterium]
FRGNSLKAGLLTIVLPEKAVQRLMDDITDDPSTQIAVSLEDRTVQWSGELHDFELDDYTRWRLMEGLDDIGLSLRHVADIDAYEAKRAGWLPAMSG